jgi:hypothetical protein
MSNGPLTPSEDADHDMDADFPDHNAHTSPQPQTGVNETSEPDPYSPHSVPYNEAFENALMTAILHPENAISNNSAHPKTPTSPPDIAISDLPLPLTSPLRTHPSPISPSILLTHANGYHTGGPGPSSSFPHTLSKFANQFISEHGIRDAGQLERAVEARIESLMGEVRERMREREEAVRRNEEVRKELSDLDGLRCTEVRVQEKIKAEGRARKGR